MAPDPVDSRPGSYGKVIRMRTLLFVAVLGSVCMLRPVWADVAPLPIVSTTSSSTDSLLPDNQYEFYLTKTSMPMWGGLLGTDLGGPRPGDAIGLLAIRCQRDDSKTRCAPVDITQIREWSDWSRRLHSCYKTRAQTMTKQGLQAVERALGNAKQPLLVDALAEAAVGTPIPVVAAIVDSERTADEFRRSGCDGERPRNMGCDPISIPTGRKIKVKRTDLIAYGPGPYRLDLYHANPPFPLVDPRRSWIVISGLGNRLLPELPLGTVGDFSTRLAAFRTRVEPWLARRPGPRMRAALLIDLAYASFGSGDAEAGRRYLGELEQLIATPGFDGRGLELEALRKPLQALASGEWSATDPCAH